VQTWARLCFLLEVIGYRKEDTCVDYGGSSGLLTRLMRDSGYSYFAYDPYEYAKYANYFMVTNPRDVGLALVTAFEVLEHFRDPAEEVARLLSTTGEFVVFSTSFYEGQGAEWDYLVPFCGQHIFFYRQNALKAFAERFGFTLRCSADLWLLVRTTSPYLPAIDAAQGVTMSAQYAGDLMFRTGYATESTIRDYAYAKERFQREVPAYARARPFLVRWLLGR